MSKSLNDLAKEILAVFNMDYTKNFLLPNYSYRKYKFTFNNNYEQSIITFHNPRINYIKITNKKEECGICMHKTKTKSNCCKQFICENCIGTWKKTNYGLLYTCPFCRTTINQKDEIDKKIFLLRLFSRR